MIKSMTGYGRCEIMEYERKFIIEIKSVNHRYNDIAIKLPRMMNPLEDAVRKILSSKISRGKTDVYITFESFSKDDIQIFTNQTLAGQYVAALHKLQEDFSLVCEDTLSLVAKFPDVISAQKILDNEDLILGILTKAVKKALEQFIAMRETEGRSLEADLKQKISFIANSLDKIKQRAPLAVTEYKEKLWQRLKEYHELPEIDENRLMTEIIFYADKSCIDEEITRLASHIAQFLEIIEENNPVGRKLDFLVQEMNREANTIASKANDLEITKLSLGLKSEIEKIREQVQNIE